MPEKKMSSARRKRLATTGQPRRKIHVDLPEDVHQRLRVRAALLDTSMQAFVSDVVSKAVSDVVLPKMKGGKAHD